MVPLKLYGFIGLGVALMVLIVWFGHHERAVEDQRIAQHDAQAAAKLDKQIKKVNADATVTIQGLQVRLAAVLAAPPTDHVVIRLCQPARQAAVPTRSDAGPVAASDGTGGSVEGVPDAVEASQDIGDPAEMLLRRVGAKLAYLQGYVIACQNAGLCARE